MNQVFKFTKKPITIEAMYYSEATEDLIIEWITAGMHKAYTDKDPNVLKIHTLEGEMVANIGDWIIKGISGEFYPCKNDIFERTYEKGTLE